MKTGVVGVSNVSRYLENQRIKTVNNLSNELREGAKEIERAAKRDAPKDFGRLAGSITTREISPMKFEVVASSQVAAVMEFGTGSKVQVESGFETYAIGFKGIKIANSGTLSDNILEWVKRKRIGQGRRGPALKRRRAKGETDAAFRRIAFLIARSIARFGVEAHPFLLHNFKEVSVKVLERLKNITK